MGLDFQFVGGGDDDRFRDLHWRKGRLLIDHHFLNTWPEEVMLIMGRCVIIRAEFLYHTRCMEYYAFSPDFELLKEGEPVPSYTFRFKSGDQGPEIDGVERGSG